MEHPRIEFDTIRIQTARMMEIYALLKGELEKNAGLGLTDQTRAQLDRAIDTNPASAWGIHPPRGRPHRALAAIEKPLAAAKGDMIEIELHQNHGRQHLIGRPRLSLTHLDKPGFYKPLSLHIIEILALNLSLIHI